MVRTGTATVTLFPNDVERLLGKTFRRRRNLRKPRGVLCCASTKDMDGRARTEPEKLTLKAFLTSKRGFKQLHRENVVPKLVTYFAGRGTTVTELPTSAPPSASSKELEDLQERGGVAGLRRVGGHQRQG